MSNIGSYQGINQGSNPFVKKNSYTEKVIKFVEELHELIPAITEEFDDLEKRREAKPCKAFDDKLRALNNIFLAEKDLYYWYVEQPKSKQQ